MYSGIQKIEEVIDRIEQHITEELDVAALAAAMQLSVYEFRRIFAFVVGCPLSEYVRRRRLSLAACEIAAADRVDMLAISEKYGYKSQSAFIKAFGEQHGLSPTAYLKEKAPISLFTRPRFCLQTSGGETIPLRVIRAEAFIVRGYTGLSTISDTCCCEDVWSGFYDSGTADKLPHQPLYAVYQNRDEDVACTIGTTDLVSDTLAAVTVPAGRWACFTLNTVEDAAVNETYSRILYEWLPSANLRRDDSAPIVEVYPYDMEQDGFTWEIRIPCE